MRHPVSRELFAYWDRLRAGRSAPERSDIDPAAIRGLLPYTFMLELDEQADARTATFRLSGTRLNALFRRELKGHAFAEIWDPAAEPDATAFANGVLDARIPGIAGLSGRPPEDRAADFELLLLPLRHHGRTHARLFGSLAAESVPSWIGLRSIGGLRLQSFRMLLARDAGRLGTFGRPAPISDAGRVPLADLRPGGRLAGGHGRPVLKVFQGGRAATAQGGVAAPGLEVN